MTVIITAGMIGVGKTTLTGILAEHLGSQAFYEPVADNPILPKFYADRQRASKARETEESRLAETARDLVNDKITQEEATERFRFIHDETYNHYAFSLQIFFLTRRFEMIKKALADNNNILDRSIYEDALFTKLNYEDGGISSEEYDIYRKLLSEMMEQINDTAKQRPDLLIMLDADFETILARIRKRGRPSEQIDDNDEQLDYFKRLWEGYRQWYENYDYSPKMRIDLGKYDLSKPENAKVVLQLIDQKRMELGLV